MLAIIFITSFAAVGLLVFGLAMKGERAVIRGRIEALSLADERDLELAAPEMVWSFGDRAVRPALRKLSRLLGAALPTNSVANVAAQLDQAGNPYNLRPAEFIGLKLVSLIIFLGAGIAYAVLFRDAATGIRVLAVVLGGVIGYALPDSLLQQAIRERHRMIRKALADCLDLLVVCAEAGLGFEGAVAKVAARTRGPLADELEKMLQDISIGRSRADGLKAMASRVGLPELTTFVAAIRQADLLGVSIAKVLRVQGDSLRSQRNLRAREAAAKLPVKLLFPLVFCIFPSIFIVLLGPVRIQIMNAFGIGR